MNPDLEREILAGVEQDVRRVFTDAGVDPIHDILHVWMVAGNIKQISEGEGYDPFVPQLTARLHDVGRIDEIKARQEGRSLPHAQASADQVPLLLAGYNLDGSIIATVQDAVSRHSDLNQNDDSLVAIYLKEADRLAGLGAVGIARNLVESGTKGRRVINLDNPFPNGPIKPSRFREPEASAIEALLFISEWYGMFRTKTGEELSRPLAGVMARYLWGIACETNMREACARNTIVQALSKNDPDVQEAIKHFLLT